VGGGERESVCVCLCKENQIEGFEAFMVVMFKSRSSVL